MSEEEKRKVYSPDIKPYSFDGSSGVYGTLLSIVVGPIRLLSRVMHNIFILPAELQLGYARSLKLISFAMLVLGIIDLLFFKKWPLVVSQLPVLYYAIRLEKRASRATQIARKKREVDIDLDEVGDLCNSIYDDFNEALEDD